MGMNCGVSIERVRVPRLHQPGTPPGADSLDAKNQVPPKWVTSHCKACSRERREQCAYDQVVVSDDGEDVTYGLVLTAQDVRPLRRAFDLAQPVRDASTIGRVSRLKPSPDPRKNRVHRTPVEMTTHGVARVAVPSPLKAQ